MLRGSQNEGALVESPNSAAEDERHDAMMGYTPAPDFNMDLDFSPPAEPGPSYAPRISQVFEVAPESEPEEEGDGDAEAEWDDGTYVWFDPDVESETEDGCNDKASGMHREDPKIVRGKEAYRLECEQEQDILGMYMICL